MTTGLPDFYRSINIGKQELSQMIVRPKYGGALQTKGSLVVDASGATRLAAISGKGVLYGGTVWLDAAGLQGNSLIQMKLDGWILSSLSFVRMKDYGVFNPRSSVFSLNVINSEDYIYSVGLSYGITFESYLDLYYYEAYGDTPNVFYDIVYALI